MALKTPRDLWIEMSIREISTQSLFASISYANIEPKAISSSDLVFSSIHSFLSHSAIISKMLKAQEDTNTTISIGTILGISENSLIHKRTFRNALEHYDKELKKWISQFDLNSPIGTYNIGPKAGYKIPGMIFVSHYDPNTYTFTFINDDFDLRALYNEVMAIKESADNWVLKLEQKIINPPLG